MTYFKYPRTPHLPWSLGASKDDKKLKSIEYFLNKNVVVTEKMDGENTTLYSDHLHARSLDSRDHWSRHWLKGLHAQIKENIPVGFRICGENLYAKHSIKYENLSNYFLAFSVWENERCLSWPDFEEYIARIGIPTVPVIWQGVFDEKILHGIEENLDFEKTEGYVLRLEESFQLSDFQTSVAKFVRTGHVQTDEHWMYNRYNKERSINSLKELGNGSLS